MSRNIKRHVEVEIHPDSHELAECFWAMGAEEQCAFLNHLAAISDGKLPFQLRAIIDSPHLTNEARHVMQAFGEYGEAAPYKPTTVGDLIQAAMKSEGMMALIAAKNTEAK
jgi:hypothetical protein